jgi:DNA-binding NarL/FixJ family response regulator
MLRIVIIDDQPLFCRGIRSVLERAGCHPILSASPSIVALEATCLKQSPHLAIIGDLSCADPVEVAHLLRRLLPTITLIFLTDNQDEEHFFQAIKVGVAAYALRTTVEEELVEMVRKVSRGEYLLSDSVLSQPRKASRVFPPCREPLPKQEAERRQQVSPLTGREMEIVDFVARGRSNKEIAKALPIIDQTVKNHMTSILKKLSVKDRTAAVVHALQHGWVELGT